MKKHYSMAIFVVALIFMFSLTSYSQFPEDALRFSFPGLGVGARSLSLGMAFTAVSNDFSAIYSNPAGLGQMRLNEVSFGLSNLSYGNTSGFFGNQQSFTNSSTNINGAGLVYPFPTDRGSLVFAVGYGKQSDFTTGLSFSGFNPQSSIIQSFAPDGGMTNDPSGNLAYELWLANADSLLPNNFRWDSRIKNNVTQSGKVLEGGGLNHVSVAVAVEAARKFYLGATANFITGSYSYSRNYYEDDLKNLYTVLPFDFTSLTLHETVESDLSGFTAKLGMLYRFGRNGRLGFTVKTPSWITVREIYSQEGMSLFDNGDNFSYATASNVGNEYDVVTPFIFSAGISQAFRGLLLAADVEYTDWTQMEFRNAGQRLLSFNTDIKEIFRPTVNFKGGVELDFGNSDVRLRGGFAYLPSPYNGDPSSFAQKYVTGGIGFIVENAIAIDLGFAHGFWDTFRVNYDVSSKVTENVKTNNLITTVSYRF